MHGHQNIEHVIYCVYHTASQSYSYVTKFVEKLYQFALLTVSLTTTYARKVLVGKQGFGLSSVYEAFNYITHSN
jgi:hypothetical protein